MQQSETLRFFTRTPDGFDELLRGAAALPRVEIEGTLNLPPNGKGKLPLVIVSIGSRGLTSGREALYTAALNKIGVATLIVDSFSSRGFAETTSDQGKLSFAASVADALFAVDHMRDDPRFDSGRLALLGYSRGGLATVMAYDLRLQMAVLGREENFCAHVALYPPCYIQWQNPRPPSVPMLSFFGGRDVQALATTGEAFMKRLNELGGKVQVITYPEAVHSFDAARPAAPTGGINLALAEIIVQDDGRMFEHTTGLRAEAGWSAFLKDLRQSVGRPGSITGHGPLPRDVAVQPISEFLSTAFGLGRPASPDKIEYSSAGGAPNDES